MATASYRVHKLDVDRDVHFITMMENLNSQREDSKDCDFIIEVDGNELPAHQNVLKAGSEYFKAMLSHDSIEKANGVVKMKEVDFDCVKTCVDYIYSGEAKVTEEGSEDLLHVAKIMQLDTLCHNIEKFLSSCLTPSSFYDIRRVALKYTCKVLNDACTDYALKNLGALSKELDFSGLDVDFMLLLMASQNSPYLEDAKLSVALKWINADVENRRCHVRAIVETLHLDKISDEYKRFLAENEPVCYESSECMRMFLLNNTRKVESSNPVVPYHGTNNLIIVFNQSLKRLVGYCPSRNFLQKMPALEKELPESLGYTAVYHEKLLYVLTTAKKVFQFNVVDKSSTWIRLNDMKFEHGKYLQAAFCQGSIYVAGENTIERLDLDDISWQALSTENVILNECAMTTFNRCLYVIGGKNNNEIQGNVFKYNPVEQKWNSVRSLRKSRALAAAVAHKTVLFTGGGYNLDYHHRRNFHKSVESYMQSTDVWTLIKHEMSCCHVGFRMCIADNKLYAVGSSEAATEQILEDYDLHKMDAWEATSLPEKYLLMPTASFAFFKPT